MYATSTDFASAKLTQTDIARLSDAALEVILRHGVEVPSVDVELNLWNALNREYRFQHRAARWLSLTHSRTPSQNEVLSALARASYRVAVDSGASEEELRELELDLLFTFGLVETPDRSSSLLIA